jgi:hypothetical protein
LLIGVPPSVLGPGVVPGLGLDSPERYTSLLLSSAGFDPQLLAISHQSAFALQPEPRLLLNIGRMQQKLGNFAEAQKSYQQFLSSPSRADDAPYRSKALEWLKEVEAQVLLRGCLGIGTIC